MHINGQPLCLRQNIKLEPLVDQWYCWSHLIPPATAARNVTERHLKIMDSYINAPLVHANAVKNPKMLGGPFIDYDGQHVDEIKALRDNTRKKRANMLELSVALAELDNMLRRSAKGYSLIPLYSSMPPVLKGYVELVYDLNNNPNFRLVEPLLFKSKYYDVTAQSLMLSEITGDDRPFVLSTPRLKDPDSVHLPIPFEDKVVDDLFRLKTRGMPWSKIRDMLNLSDEDAEVFQKFLTPEPAPPYEPYKGKGVRWRYFGHACILIETATTSMLFDPVLSYTYENNISRYTYRDLPDSIDYVLITHNHQDHVLFETLLQIRHKVRTIVVPRNGPATLQDPSLKLTLQACGFNNVIELNELESVHLDNGEITGIPFFGEHSDLDVRTKLAYLVRLGKHKLFFAADSCNISPELYEHLHCQIGDVEALFLGMECDGAPLTWIYGPLLSHKLERRMDESRRLSGSNYDQAIDIVTRFNCKDAYVYAMGQEPWLNYVMSLKYTEESRPIIDSNRLMEECRKRGIVCERLFGEKEILLD